MQNEKLNSVTTLLERFPLEFANHRSDGGVTSPVVEHKAPSAMQHCLEVVGRVLVTAGRVPY